MLNGSQVKLQAKADADATFDKEGTTLVIRRASKPAGGYNYIPGVVNIKSGRFNLYANISGQTVANVDSTLCYPGTWRIVDYKTDRMDSAGALIDRYRAQLSLYKETVEDILQLPVRETWLYGFNEGLGEIRIPE